MESNINKDDVKEKEVVREKNSDILKSKKTKKSSSKLMKGLMTVSAFYLISSISTISYIENKAKSIVTPDQRAALSMFTSKEKSDQFLEDSFKADYSNEMYNEDYKIYGNFKNKMKQDF